MFAKHLVGLRAFRETKVDLNEVFNDYIVEDIRLINYIGIATLTNEKENR